MSDMAAAVATPSTPSQSQPNTPAQDPSKAQGGQDPKQTQGGAYLPLTGGTMSGPVNMGANNLTNVTNVMGQWGSNIDMNSFTLGMYCPFFNAAWSFTADGMIFNLPSGKSIHPTTTDAEHIGNPTNRWGDLYLAGKACVTTDTGSTLGTVVGKYPLYDTSGTLVGYLPIYDSIS